MCKKLAFSQLLDCVESSESGLKLGGEDFLAIVEVGSLEVVEEDF